MAKISNYKSTIEQLKKEAGSIEKQGEVATYIPELAKVDPESFGFALHCVDGTHHSFGQSEVRFSVQSIAKVFGLALAISRDAQQVWRRIGVEPSGDPFNSLVLLEHESGIPRNPLVNPGAIVVCDILLDLFDDPLGEILAMVQHLARSKDIAFDDAVARSEASTSDRNRALAHLMASFGNIGNKVEEVLQFYIRLCAISMSCSELSRAFSFLANRGATLPETVRLTESQIRRVNAIMLTCGFYDEAGEFAFSVGLPGKSGVGGGIVAVSPGEFSVATWSPRLTKGGNSFLGTHCLERLTTLTGCSIF